MRSHFSRDPPVYAKPKQPQQPQQQDSRPSSLPSSPPTPAQSLDQRPALPPKPPSSAASPPLLQPVLPSAQPSFSHHPSNGTPAQSANPSSSPRYQSVRLVFVMFLPTSNLSNSYSRPYLRSPRQRPSHMYSHFNIIRIARTHPHTMSTRAARPS